MLSVILFAIRALQRAINTLFHFLTGNYFLKISEPSLPSRTMTHILILGGSFSGVGTAHRILKEATKASLPVKVTLVSPNTDFYWNVAVPRAIIPGLIADDKIFQPIAPGFRQYPSNKFEFILARAESLDFKGKRVDISGSGGTKTLEYDFLILATGSSVKQGLPFKTIGSTEATKDALHDFQAQVKVSKTIVVAGAGPTGLEIAGELADEYGQLKKIVLVCLENYKYGHRIRKLCLPFSSNAGLYIDPSQLAGGPKVLDSAPDSVSRVASQHLRNIKVDIKLQAKVLSSSQAPDGRQVLTLSNGETMTADMYIPTFGVTPNSSYIPAQYLNPGGFVMVDEYLKVKGADDVWAIGDISDRDPPNFMPASKQSAHLSKNIILLLSGKAPIPHKLAPKGMGILIGKKAGTGYMSGWKIPSFLVVMIRKTLFVEKLGPSVDGSDY